MTKHLYTKKKVYSILLIALMLFALLPAASWTAYALDVTVDSPDDFYNQLTAAATDTDSTITFSQAFNPGDSLPSNHESISIETDQTITFLSNSGSAILRSAADSRHMKFDVEDDCTLTLVFDGVILDGNSTSGGIEVTGGGTLKLVNANIRNCQAPNGGYGGAVYTEGDIIVEDSQFADNEAGQYGGAVYTKGNIIVEDSQFAGNKVDLDGGGIYAGKGADIKGSQFTDNEANHAGGGLSVKDDTTIKDSLFEGNTAGRNGGAIDTGAPGASIKIINSSFIHNVQFPGDGGGGGAISGGRQTIMGGSIFSGSTIVESVYNNGGTLYTPSDLVIDGGDGDTIYITSKSKNTVHANGSSNTCLNLRGSPAFLYIEGNPTAMYSGNSMIDKMEGKHHPNPYTGENVFAVVGTPKVKLVDTTLNISGLADIELLEDYLSDGGMVITVYDNGTPLDVTVKQTGSTATVDLSVLSGGTHVITVSQTLMGQYDSELSDEVTLDVPYTALSASVSPASDTITVGNSVTFTATATGGDGTYTYQWAQWDGSAWNDMNGEINATLTVTESIGSYRYRITVTDGQEAMAQAESELTVNRRPTNGGGSGSSTYTVRFESNGGSSVSSQNIVRNGKVTEPANPTRENYTFTGWYTSSSLTTRYDFNTTVTTSLTLYAGWEELDSTDEPDPEGFDHPAYINGYSDGTFRPDGTLSRAETATLFYGLLDGETPSGSVTEFSDVPTSAWYYEAVTELAKRSVISGRDLSMGGEEPTPYFAPDAPITRAEFVTMVLRFAELEPSVLDLVEGTIDFSDVSGNHWAVSSIAATVSAGYVSGYPDGTFQPNRTVTRAEAVTILNRMVECDGLSSGTTFNDVPSSHWAYAAITAAATGHDH